MARSNSSEMPDVKSRSSGKTLRIHHVLDGAEKWLRNKGYANLDFSQPQTFAAERGANDQFKGAIEISFDDIHNEEAFIERIKQLIVDITNETINRGLNLRETKLAKTRR